MATSISKDRRSSTAPAKPAATGNGGKSVSVAAGVTICREPRFRAASAGWPSPGVGGVRLSGVAHCRAGSTAREWRLRPSAAVFKTAANFPTISDTDLFTRLPAAKIAESKEFAPAAWAMVKAKEKMPQAA